MIEFVEAGKGCAGRGRILASQGSSRLQGIPLRHFLIDAFHLA
jgi:hypothetical protein